MTESGIEPSKPLNRKRVEEDPSRVGNLYERDIAYQKSEFGEFCLQSAMENGCGETVLGVKISLFSSSSTLLLFIDSEKLCKKIVL
jgi:hypothetical protein